MPATATRKHKTGKTHISPKTAAVEFFKTKLQFETTPHAVKRDLEEGKIFLLDVRDVEAYRNDRIPGAFNAPLSELERHLSSLPKDKTIVTYCWNLTCAAAPKAALFLAERGYNVQELVGGIEEWGKKFPTENSK